MLRLSTFLREGASNFRKLAEKAYCFPQYLQFALQPLVLSNSAAYKL